MNRRAFIKKASIYLALTGSIGLSGCIEINLDKEDRLPKNDNNQQSEEPNNQPTSDLEPPEISVSHESTLKKAYLGKKPEYKLLVTNKGGKCQVEGTILGQEVSGDLKKNETSNVTITLPRIMNMENRQLKIDLSATNEAGSDSFYNEITIIPELKPYNPLNDITKEMVEEASSKFIQYIKKYIGSAGLLTGYGAEAYTYYVDADCAPVQIVENDIAQRQVSDFLRAKRTYYWVRNWINYKYSELEATVLENLTDPDWSQVEHPAETIYDRTGVCLNYAVTLGSLYKAMGIKSAIIGLWDNDEVIGHLMNAIYLPDEEESFDRHWEKQNWVLLDATGGKYPFGKVNMNKINNKFDISSFAEI